MGLPRLLDAIAALPAFARVLKALPAQGASLRVGGLAGSSDAVLVAALARALPQRLVVVIADQLGDAERWLADLQALVDDVPVALYPPREGFGEVEPHAEVAGERVETLEKLGRSGVRVLLTTSRAVLEKTALPRALSGARVELRKGDVRRPEDLAAHLESIGFERVPMVEDVAQFSVRGGIFDIYSFGMAEPVRLEFWGDDIVELRHFDLNTQRSTRDAEVALVLPVDGRLQLADDTDERVSLPELWPSDTLVVMPAGSSVLPELVRTWDEAAHHIDLARRRGEEFVHRDRLFVEPPQMASTLARFGTLRFNAPPQKAASANAADLTPVGPEPDIAFPIRAPETISRDLRVLRRLQRDGLHTVILCDNAGQAERLEELLGEDGPVAASLTIGVLGGGFVVPNVVRVLTDHEIFRRDRRLRRTRRYSTGASLDTLGALLDRRALACWPLV
jgi:transcription-repair coupling factor (superfamily II helicase)